MVSTDPPGASGAHDGHLHRLAKSSTPAVSKTGRAAATVLPEIELTYLMISATNSFYETLVFN